LIDLHERQT